MALPYQTPSPAAVEPIMLPRVQINLEMVTLTALPTSLLSRISVRLPSRTTCNCSSQGTRTLFANNNLLTFSFSLLHSTDRLADRLRHGEDTISFDKDDEDTLDFVTASSNLRSYAYGIDGKTRWEVKGMSMS